VTWVSVGSETVGVPKLMTVVWVGPHDPPVRCIDSWKDIYEPLGWKFCISTSIDGWQNQAVIDALTDWGSKADVIRYEILEAHGGVTVDADIECGLQLDTEGPNGKPFVDFSSSDAFATYESEIATPGVVSTALMGGVPGALIWRRCIEEIAKLDPADPGLKKNASALVGCGLLTRLVKEIPKEKFVVHTSRVVNYEHPSNIKVTVKAAGGLVRNIPIYGRHLWGTAKTYNTMRKWPCQCAECRMIFPAWRPPWG
jgi:hypothetical protein